MYLKDAKVGDTVLNMLRDETLTVTGKVPSGSFLYCKDEQGVEHKYSALMKILKR